MEELSPSLAMESSSSPALMVTSRAESVFLSQGRELILFGDGDAYDGVIGGVVELEPAQKSFFDDVALPVDDGNGLAEHVDQCQGAARRSESDVFGSDEGLIDDAACPTNGIIAVEVPNGVVSVAVAEEYQLASLGEENGIVTCAEAYFDDARSDGGAAAQGDEIVGARARDSSVDVVEQTNGEGAAVGANEIAVALEVDGIIADAGLNGGVLAARDDGVVALPAVDGHIIAVAVDRIVAEIGDDDHMGAVVIEGVVAGTEVDANVIGHIGDGVVTGAGVDGGVGAVINDPIVADARVEG